MANCAGVEWLLISDWSLPACQPAGLPACLPACLPAFKCGGRRRSDSVALPDTLRPGTSAGAPTPASAATRACRRQQVLFSCSSTSPPASCAAPSSAPTINTCKRQVRPPQAVGWEAAHSALHQDRRRAAGDGAPNTAGSTQRELSQHERWRPPPTHVCRARPQLAQSWCHSGQACLLPPAQCPLAVAGVATPPGKLCLGAPHLRLLHSQVNAGGCRCAGCPPAVCHHPSADRLCRPLGWQPEPVPAQR